MLRTSSFCLAVLLSCHPPRAPGADAGDAQAETPRAAPAAKGTPFVVALEHSIDDAVWLPNGHLLGASRTELFDVDPATTDVRRIPLERPLQWLLGVRGGERFVAVEKDKLAIWDATKLVPLRTIDADQPTMSADGKRLAAVVCDAGRCGLTIYDLARGDALATIAAPARPDFAGEITLSDDGRWAIVHASAAVVLADATTGKVLLRRKALRLSEGGGLLEVVAFRGDRVVLSSDHGIEVITLPSGNIVAHVADPFAGHEMVTYRVDADATHVTVHDGPTEKLFTWDVAAKTTRTTKQADAPAEAAPSTRFAVQRGAACRVVERGTQRVVLEHAAACGANPLTSRAPGIRGDERLLATVFEGGAHVFDLESGKHVAGIGPLPAKKIEHLDPLVVTNGVPRLGPADPVWLTKNGPPPDPPRPIGFRSIAVTATHTFGVDQRGGKRTVVALDRAGTEVLRETLAPFDESMNASDDVVYLRQRGEEIECRVGAGCKTVAFGGFVASFDKPWLVIGPRADSAPGMQPGLVNMLTQEHLSLPAACGGHAFDVKVFRDGPKVLCGDPGGRYRLAGADGPATPVLLPDVAPKQTRLVGRAGPFLWFTGVVNAGLGPAYRLDIRRGEHVDLFLGPGHAIARFADGTIERFGDPASNDAALRCLDGDRLLPWSACGAAFEVDRKLDSL